MLLFSPSSSNPYSIRTLPFRFRNVIWNNLDKDSCNLVGITYQWNVVLCGDDVRISTGDESQSREIDRNASAIQKKTLFQDMFGKSAFVDISNIRDSTISPTQKPTEISSASSIFDSPAYQSPSVDSLYSSLMTCFLSKVSQSPEEVKVPEEQLLEMDVDMETGPSIPQGRIVDDDEVNSLVDLFRTQSINSKCLFSCSIFCMSNLSFFRPSTIDEWYPPHPKRYCCLYFDPQTNENKWNS